MLLRERFAMSAFAGDPAPPAPLTWGQQALWTELRRRGPEQATISLRRVVALRRGATPEAVVRAISALVSRHSSLRTHLRVVDGEPRQVVSASGELPVLMYDAESGNAAAEAETVARRLAAEPFDHAAELPQRFALVLDTSTEKSYVVVVFSHTTVDFRAIELLLRELRLLIVRGQLASPPGPQSVDIARREDGPERYRSERAVAYWLDGFGRLPHDTLPRLAEPASPRFRRTELVSAATGPAVALAARRCRVTTSAVLLAAVAAVMSVRSGADVAGLHVMAANRVLDDYEHAVAKLNQIALVVADATGRPGFDGLVARVWPAAVRGYRHAHYDPSAVQRAFDRAGFPYRTGVNPHCYFNDIRLAPDAAPHTPATTERDLREAPSTCTVTDEFDHFFWRVRVQIFDAPGGLGIALTGDTAHLPPIEAERFLRELERLLVAAAFRDVPWPWKPEHLEPQR
ncbi:condensation domain-containing protein [Dactylosporangium sp. NPDC051541]|uniref:condensation domain-containing protein n=1 Tax=Dactylosporangium sp. NPDC051541 TaxID=3363977 RepID=UPI00378F1D8C